MPPDSVWASASTTLEYAIDDFAVAQLAAEPATTAPPTRLHGRSANWRNLLDPVQRPDRAALRKRRLPSPYSDLRGAGFAEGDSFQYTWMVPQDPSGLFAAMGGPAQAAARLDRFLRELNGGAGVIHTDHAVLGDEPSLGAPWLYDWMRRPYERRPPCAARC